MSLPPRALNAFRLGSVAFKVRACFSSVSFTPVSKLKVLKSQFGSSKTIFLKKPLTNASKSAPRGCCPVIHNDQPPSPASPPEWYSGTDLLAFGIHRPGMDLPECRQLCGAQAAVRVGRLTLLAE